MKIKNYLIPFSTFLLIAFSVSLVSCEDDVNDENFLSSSFVSFSYDQTVAMVEGDTEVVEVPVFASSASDTDRTMSVYVDESSTLSTDNYSAPSSVTIPAGSTQGMMEVVVTNSPNIGFGGATIVLGMTAMAGVDQPTTFSGSAEAGTLEVTNNMMTITAKTLCEDNQVVMSFTLDPWPEEVYWWLLDENGEVVASPGAYAQYANPYAGLSGEIIEEICIPSGTYTFEIYDDYGDGGGAVSVTSGGVTLWSSDGGYGSYASATFTL
tara:strand:- start:2788 stop:3585 length:798 start_codon:yes stop_codon:yes gene_type:complete